MNFRFPRENQPNLPFGQPPRQPVFLGPPVRPGLGLPGAPTGPFAHYDPPTRLIPGQPPTVPQPGLPLTPVPGSGPFSWTSHDPATFPGQFPGSPLGSGQPSGSAPGQPLAASNGNQYTTGGPWQPVPGQQLSGPNAPPVPGYASGTNFVPAFRHFPQQNLVAGLQKPVKLGALHPYAHGVSHVPGQFIGRDSVPSMLEPGEAVLNRGAMQAPGMRAKVAYMNRLGLQGHAAGSSMIQSSHRGLLHQDLGIPEGQKIPFSRLESAKHSASPAIRKRANFAINFGH